MVFHNIHRTLYSMTILVWSGFVIFFLGGFASLWWLSERFQKYPDTILRLDSSGVTLNGTYVIENWFIFSVAFFFYLPALSY